MAKMRLDGRLDGRTSEKMRELKIDISPLKYAEGSCMLYLGNTQVLCSASVENQVPHFLRGSGKGWVTAEYSMLPRATHSRSDRLKQLESARSKEIGRLIGRSLRAVCHSETLGERQIKIDCDVIQADGGTRTASIIGAYVALAIAVRRLQKYNVLEASPITQAVGALSCGIVEGELLCDLCYEEDSKASCDANFALTEDGRIVEVQASAEQEPFTSDAFSSLLTLAQNQMSHIFAVQKSALQELEASL